MKNDENIYGQQYSDTAKHKVGGWVVRNGTSYMECVLIILPKARH